jgi:flagellar protein FlbD
MIRLTRLNHESFVVNLVSIQYIESTPDTLIAFNNGDRILVEETVDEILALSLAYHQRISRGELPNEAIGAKERA